MPASEWTIEAPANLEFDDVTGLRVRLIAGSVAVLATTGKPSLEVSSVEGDPLSVTYENGVLTVGPPGTPNDISHFAKVKMYRDCRPGPGRDVRPATQPSR